jgi:hypothetical protein
MPFNDTQKRFLWFILGIGALVALVFYLAFGIPEVGKYAYMIVLGIAGIFILYVSFLPLFSYLSERADVILNVYLDESGKGIHIFSAYSVSRYKTNRAPLRYIQHYFIVTGTGKLYYKVLFNHTQQPLAGQAGYPAYSSFEESVLGSDEFKQSMDTFSRKVNIPLHLGKHVGTSDEDQYMIHTGGCNIEIRKFKGTLDDVFEVLCYDANSNKLAWKRKI